MYLYSPDVIASPSSVTMTSNTAQVSLSSPDPTVHSTFTFSSSQPWLSVTSDSTSLPATLTLTVIPGNSYDDGSIAVFPSDPRLATFKIPFGMGNRPFNITSNAAQASITVEQVTVPLPYSNLAVPGSRINLGAPDQTPSPGTAYRFESWSDSGSRNHRVTMPLEGLTLGVQFGTWYQPTLAVNPPGAGTVVFSTASPDGFYRAGTQNLIVQANPGYKFTGFSGGVSGTTTVIQLGGPLAITANFAALPRVTFTSNLPVTETASLIVGGTSYPFPSTVTLDAGSVSIAAPASVASALSPATRYSFQRWSDGITTPARNYTVTADATLTAVYATEVLVSVTANPPSLGSATGGGWFTPGANLTIQATPNAGEVFTGFTGDLTTTQTPASYRRCQRREHRGELPGDGGRPVCVPERCGLRPGRRPRNAYFPEQHGGLHRGCGTHRFDRFHRCGFGHRHGYGAIGAGELRRRCGGSVRVSRHPVQLAGDRQTNQNLHQHLGRRRNSPAHVHSQSHSVIER